MANEIIGRVYRIAPTEAKRLDSGKTIYERGFVLDATRRDQWTGEPMYPNFPQFTVTGEERCTELDKFAVGTLVKVSFEIQGAKYEKEGEEKFFNRVRAYKIELFGRTHQSAPVVDSVPPLPDKEPDFMPENNGAEDLPFM